MAYNIQLKRSAVAQKRPLSANMLPGEINLNINASSTGLFFANESDELVKVGPAHVGAAAPNVNPAGGAGHSLGEFWYDTSSSLLKIFNGTEFVAVESGEVRTVTGTGAISVDSTDAENPVISVASASTTTPGVVQLTDNTNSTSVVEALTANQGKVLQDQINSLSLSSNITLGGTFDPDTGLMVTVTVAGVASGFVVGEALPAPAPSNSEVFVISEGYSTAYTPTDGVEGEYHVGDWLLSDGSTYNFLNVGQHSNAATTDLAGIVELSTDAETQAGTATNVAVTPSTLQSKVSDSVSLDSSTTLASSKAVKDANDARISAEADLATDIASEQARAEAAEDVLTVGLADEVSRATAAETLNTQAISSEASRAQGAEQVLTTALAAEVTRATDAEQVNADAIAALETSSNGGVAAEQARAEAAEVANSQAIASEIARAEAAELANATSISDEQSRAETAEAANAALIAAEQTRATDAEAANALAAITAVNAEQTRAEAAELVNSDAIAAEQARAEAAEAALELAATDAVAVEQARAEAAEQANADAVAAEKVRAEAAEAVNAAAVATEKVRAETAEAANASDIATEQARATLAEQTNAAAVAAEKLRAETAEAGLQSQIVATNAAVAAETLRAQTAEAGLATDIAAEEVRATGAEDALDGRVSNIEENLNTPITTIFDGTPAAGMVVADGASPLADPGYQDGWYYTNEENEKINWYFYDGVSMPSTFGTASFYAVMTLNTTVSSAMPFFSIYSAPTGTNDAETWYKSRKHMHVADPSTLALGKKYLFVIGEDPQVHPELERVFLEQNTLGSEGTCDDAEALQFASLGTSSSLPENSTNFLAESLGSFTEEGGDAELQLRFRKASVAEIEAAFDFGTY